MAASHGGARTLTDPGRVPHTSQENLNCLQANADPLPRPFTTAEKYGAQAHKLSSDDVRLLIVTDHPDFRCLREGFKDDAKGSGTGFS